MKITQRTEGDLILRLQKGSVSVPMLQLEMNVSYKDAKSLIQYALNLNWLGACDSGNEYPVITKDFMRKNLSAEVCKKVYDALEYDDLKLLCYFESHFSATFADILNEVDEDAGDMQSAVATLIGLQIVFKIEDYYFCTLSAKSIKKIQEARKKPHSGFSEFYD